VLLKFHAVRQIRKTRVKRFERVGPDSVRNIVFLLEKKSNRNDTIFNMAYDENLDGV
jgi:hypothetical protein